MFNNLETIFCIIIILFLHALRRVYSARKNGAFYAKNNTNCTDEKVKSWVKNIHLLESPAWYIQFSSLFFTLFTIMRLADFNLLQSSYSSFIVTMLTSLSVEYSFQKWINLGSGLPAINPKENPKSEFTFALSEDRKISYWWPRFWYGERRVYVSLFSVLSLVTISIILIFKSI